MWINNIIVGFVDDFLVAAAQKGGIWMQIGRAMVEWIDRHVFRADLDLEDGEQDTDPDICEESLAGGV